MLASRTAPYRSIKQPNNQTTKQQCCVVLCCVALCCVPFCAPVVVAAAATRYRRGRESSGSGSGRRLACRSCLRPPGPAEAFCCKAAAAAEAIAAGGAGATMTIDSFIPSFWCLALPGCRRLGYGFPFVFVCYGLCYVLYSYRHSIFHHFRVLPGRVPISISTLSINS